MAININWEDENGKCLESWPGFTGKWDWYFMDYPQIDTTRCLGFIDHYGDTTFNQHQIPVLIEELKAYGETFKEDIGASDSLKSLVNFIQKAQGQIHTYIKFVGD